MTGRNVWKNSHSSQFTELTTNQQLNIYHVIFVLYEKGTDASLVSDTVLSIKGLNTEFQSKQKHDYTSHTKHELHLLCKSMVNCCIELIIFSRTERDNRPYS